MKTIRKILIGMLCVGLVMSCSKSDSTADDLDGVTKKGNAELKTVTVPFEVNLLGTITNVDFEDPECIDEGYPCHVTLEVSGTATHMGKVSTSFDFCTDGPPDPDVPGSVYTFAASSSVMIAANGDKLFLDFGASGAITNSGEYPDYVTEYWRDVATISGGTGRFEGASGELLMDDYCTNIDDYTHHHWYGEITLVKGRR